MTRPKKKWQKVSQMRHLPLNIADRMFQLTMKHPRSGFRMPEMTVNAMLIDSGELNARWSYANGTDSWQRAGNIQTWKCASFPWIDKNCRFILRHMGPMIHLRNQPAKTIFEWPLRNDQSLWCGEMPTTPPSFAVARIPHCCILIVVYDHQLER